MEEKRLDCLRCGAEMRYIGKEKLQLGRMNLLLGNLPNLLAGAMELDILACPTCGKIEFFSAPPSPEEYDTPQRTCPSCGKPHDFDYPKCPFCKFDYYSGK